MISFAFPDQMVSKSLRLRLISTDLNIINCFAGWNFQSNFALARGHRDVTGVMTFWWSDDVAVEPLHQFFDRLPQTSQTTSRPNHVTPKIVPRNLIRRKIRDFWGFWINWENWRDSERIMIQMDDQRGFLSKDSFLLSPCKYLWITLFWNDSQNLKKSLSWSSIEWLSVNSLSVFLFPFDLYFLGNFKNWIMAKKPLKYQNSLKNLFNIWWLFKIGLRKWNFFRVKEFFSWILISKMDVKMNLKIITNNHPADSKIGFPLQVDFRVDSTHESRQPWS